MWLRDSRHLVVGRGVAGGQMPVVVSLGFALASPKTVCLLLAVEPGTLRDWLEGSWSENTCWETGACPADYIDTVLYRTVQCHFPTLFLLHPSLPGSVCLCLPNCQLELATKGTFMNSQQRFRPW